MTRLARTSILWLAGLGALAGCRAYSTVVDVPLDCTVEDAYDFMSIDAFDPGESPPWFGAGDALCSDGGGIVDPTPPIETIEAGGRCGSTAALVLRSAGCNDWGALYGDYSFGPKDASAWEGLSFWARAPGETAKGFTIVLDDKNTATPTNSVPVTNCTPYDAGVSSSGSTTTMVVTNGNIIAGGTNGPQPPPDACGQSYNAVFTVTTGWRFYTIPFTEFTQPAAPNRVPNAAFDGGNVPGTGLLTSGLMNLIFRLPKESRSELWLDNLSFYRPKGWQGWPPNGGAAADAAQP